MKFRSKAAEVEAVQWTGDNNDEVLDWMGEQYADRTDLRPQYRALWCEKADRWVNIEPGDWIIREPDGDGFYPCKPDIFASRWEPVDQYNPNSPLIAREQQDEVP